MATTQSHILPLYGTGTNEILDCKYWAVVHAEYGPSNDICSCWKNYDARRSSAIFHWNQGTTEDWLQRFIASMI